MTPQAAAVPLSKASIKVRPTLVIFLRLTSAPTPLVRKVELRIVFFRPFSPGWSEDTRAYQLRVPGGRTNAEKKSPRLSRLLVEDRGLTGVEEPRRDSDSARAGVSPTVN